MRFYIGNTDWHWFQYLRSLNPAPEDVNFWRPGNSGFQAIPTKAPFLLRLKAPINKIAGVGFFIAYTRMPLLTAWEYFGDKNGCKDLGSFVNLIMTYRRKNGLSQDSNPIMGAIAITKPVFFSDSDFLEVPSNWKSSIVSGKVYKSTDREANRLWNQVEEVLSNYQNRYVDLADFSSRESTLRDPGTGYNSNFTTNVRMGQASFRISVLKAYGCCAFTGEKIIPTLEAAHIRSYAEYGPHEVPNGLLLRADIHKLFDHGYLTITHDHRIEVSLRIREESPNAAQYLSLHGQKIFRLPALKEDYPHKDYIDWHNQSRFKS